MGFTTTFFILAATCILITITLVYLLNKKNYNQLLLLLSTMFGLLLIWILGLILQLTYSNAFNINPIYFDYIVYIATCFLPVIFLFLSITFSRTKFNFTKKYLLFFVIPIISLIVLWTNDFHHLFYKVYSTNQKETVFGPYFYIHSIYTYALFIISIFSLLKYSIKNSGFFSKQAILILLGSLIPLSINILGFLNIVEMNIYMTPIAFVITVLCYTFAIFKYDFLKGTPIALQRIVDRISDGYIVVNENNIITDFNKTFLDLFRTYCISSKKYVYL